MIEIRRGHQRGFANHGWLQSFHSFSFADYLDPRRMGWGNLRVINEDRVAPGRGFGSHSHRDMEIISYVLDGALAHQDNLGNHATIVPGDVQRMSAGSGVTHSEFNHSPSDATHFLQIWLLPDQRAIAPSYEQRHFDAASRRGQLRLVASRDGRNASVRLHADADLFAGLFDGDEAAELALDPARKAYVHLISGRLAVNGEVLNAGDAALLSDSGRLRLADGDAAEVLVFDLAP
ncbi:pirin family protein [Piscinibacter sakaiensis]|uniref:pirin family protein n=1 Tax=Piscinibacter sakaiensis TaxID=1547922 RepID=UPI003AAD9D05